MTSRPAPLTQTAARRASLEVRGPVSRSIGRAGSSRLGAEAERVERPAGAGLTLRERRIKAILLKELEEIAGKEYGAGLSYAEKQHLEKTLDAEFIDKELWKMDRAEGRMRIVRNWLAIPLALAAIAIAIWGVTSGEPLWNAVFPAITPLFLLFSFTQQSKAAKRRRWIYEALRELSDADDLDVQLPESVALADLLIDRIVEAEDNASAVPLRRIRA